MNGRSEQPWTRGEYRISTDRAELDMDVIHGFLHEAYWSPGIPRDLLERAIEHSLPFSLFHGDTQVGFARVVTDHATFAYVCDVFVLPEHRGQGLATWLMEAVVAHPEVAGLRRWMLLTRDAHNVYRRVGFQPIADPRRYMEKTRPVSYREESPAKPGAE